MSSAVIFDVDGTLVDSVDLHAESWQLAFAHFNIVVDFEEVRSQIGKGADQLLPVFLSEKQLKEQGKKIEKYKAELFEREYFSQVHAFPRVRSLLQRILADGQQIALATSAKSDELERYKRIALIDDLVERQATSDDAEASKPHPDIFLAALDRLHGVSLDQVTVVGDTPHDARAANAAGLQMVGVLCGGFPEADLRNAGCIEIYLDPADLLAHYSQSLLAPAPLRKRA